MITLPALTTGVIVLIAAVCVLGMLRSLTGAVYAQTDVHDLCREVAERLEHRRAEQASKDQTADVEILDDDHDAEPHTPEGQTQAPPVPDETPGQIPAQIPSQIPSPLAGVATAPAAAA